MIVTRTGEESWVCLARRGMLHSECEAVDLVVLAAGESLSRRGRDGIGEVWYLLSGAATTGDGTPVAAGSAVVITPDDRSTSLTANAATRLVTVSVLPDRTAARLPRRRPDLLTH